jgi:hypothetical protein
LLSLKSKPVPLIEFGFTQDWNKKNSIAFKAVNAYVNEKIWMLNPFWHSLP